MKTKTIISDVTKYHAVEVYLRKLESARKDLQKISKEFAQWNIGYHAATSEGGSLTGYRECDKNERVNRLSRGALKVYQLAQHYSDSKKAYKKIPANRRQQAYRLYQNAGSYAHEVACNGLPYSGELVRKGFVFDQVGGLQGRAPVLWEYKDSGIYTESSAHCFADTELSDGARYGGRASRYCKTDVVHTVGISIESAVNLHINEQVASCSKASDLPLIHISEKPVLRNLEVNVYECIWVANSYKRIGSVKGFIAYDSQRDIDYHSTASAKDCLAGLRRKTKKLVKKRDSQREVYKRLATEDTISMQDIRAVTSWCLAGCMQWATTYMPGAYDVKKGVVDRKDLVEAVERFSMRHPTDRFGHARTLRKLLGMTAMSENKEQAA